MKSIFSLIVSLAFLQFSLVGQTLEPITIFSENFESPDALSQWQIAPNGGRVRIAEDPRNAANHGLLMDDPINDAIFTQNAVSKTISIAGYTDIRVIVDILSFNDEPNNATNAFDGVKLRVGDKVQYYQTYSAAEMHFEIPLDRNLQNLALNGDGSLTIELDQYDNFSAPDDGLFFDNVRVVGFNNRQIIVEAPLTVNESDPLNVTVLLSPPPTEPVQLQLWDGTTEGHGYAIYPAGVTFAQLTFPDFDDNQLNGDRQVYLSVTDGHFYSSFYLWILDDEFAGLTITAPPTMVEGSSTNGSVSLSAPHDNWINVQLHSSDPTLVAVPDYAGVSGSSATFTITTFENRRVLPDREVTITASLGKEHVDYKIKVTERNSLVPETQGPAEIAEGAQDVPYTVGFDGISDQPITVTLSATPASVTVNPNTVTFQPGQSRASFNVSVADDSDAQGDRPFTILAQNNLGQQSQFAGKIDDNEIAGFSLEMPDSLQADAPISVLVRAVNHDNRPVNAFTGTANIYLKDKTSGAEHLLTENLAFSDGTAIFTLNLPYTARGSSLVIRSSTGVTFTSRPIVIFTKLTFAANDMAWDPKRKLLYATSGGNAIPGHLQSLTPINPLTAEIGLPLFLGGDPRKVAITDDGKYLYVGLATGYSVRRIDLDTFTSVANIILTADSVFAGDSFWAYDLLPISGRPLDFIASESHSASSYHTTRLYVNGVMQQSNAWNAYELAPGGSPDEFYAYNSYDSGFQFMRFKLSAGGFDALSTVSGLLTGYNLKIAGQNGLVFSTNGRVIDGGKMEAVADLDLPSSWNAYSYPSIATTMTPDVSLSRVYYAHGRTIASFDTGVFQLISTIDLPSIGNISKVLRWGDAGIAVLTENAELLLLEDDRIVPTGAAADLDVTIAATPQTVFLSDDLTYTATVQNIGTNSARAVRLAFDLSGGQAVKSIDSGPFTVGYRGTNFFIEMGDMQPGDNHTVHLVVTPTSLSTLVTSVGALSSSLDNVYSNNHAFTIVNVGFKSSPNSVNLLRLPINDLQPNSATGELIVSIPANAPSGIANHLLVIDPTTGLITKSIALWSEPNKLAVSDDGTTAYAITTSRNTAFCVDLLTGQILRTISFASTFGSSAAAYDLKVLHGSRDSILVACGSDGVRIYDKAVLRGQNSGYSGSYLALLPDPTLAFGVDSGSGAFKYKIGATGVTVLSQGQNLLYSVPLKSDDYYVYSFEGKAIRGDLMATAGTFDLNTAFAQSSYSAISVEPDRAHRRVFFSRGSQIASFDSDTYLRLRTVSLNLPANMTTLERWGPDGFAARLDNGNLAIIRSDLVPEIASGIDLLVSIPDGLQVDLPNITITGQAYHGQGIASVKVGGTNATSNGAFTDWAANIGPLSEGENLITITATSLGVPVETRTVTRKINYIPAAGALIDPQWTAAHFGSTGAAQSGANDDPDGDGQSNFAEFLFGTDPLTADKPQLHLQQVEGGAFAIQFKRRNTPDFDFVIEVSSDLATWQPVTSQTTDTQIAGADNYLSSTLQLPTASANQFCRIHAVRK